MFFSRFLFRQGYLFFSRGFLGFSEGRLFRPEEKPRDLRGKNKYLRRNKNAEKKTSVFTSVGQIELKPLKKGKKPFVFITVFFLPVLKTFSVFFLITRVRIISRREKNPGLFTANRYRKPMVFYPAVV